MVTIKLNRKEMDKVGIKIIDIIGDSKLTKYESLLVVKNIHESFKETITK